MSLVEPEPNKPAEAQYTIMSLDQFQIIGSPELYSMVKKAEHSLQVVAEEFKEICELKISKSKGRHSANDALIFTSWLRDIDMCIHDHKLTQHKAVELIKEFTTDQTWGAVEFCLDSNEESIYSKLVKHIKNFV